MSNKYFQIEFFQEENSELRNQLEISRGLLLSKANEVQGLSVSLDEEKYKNSLSDSERQSIGQNSLCYKTIIQYFCIVIIISILFSFCNPQKAVFEQYTNLQPQTHPIFLLTTFLKMRV